MTAICCETVSSQTIDHRHDSRASVTMQDACKVNQGLVTCSRKILAQTKTRTNLSVKFSDITCTNAIKGAPKQDK